jgi:NADPH:quinone reductase-like Zn-dependent oxidoreductase
MRYTVRMRAVTIADGRISVEDRPDPVPGSGQLLVRVCAAGLNAADMMQLRGLYPAPPGVPADIPGMELAGEVVGLGEGSTRYHRGDRVMSLVGGGAQAELAIVDESVAMPVPAALDWPAAGGFPEVFTTAHDALASQCQLQRGERLLVTGAAGGVGTAAVQIGIAIGARVVASVRQPAFRSAVAELGAEVVDPSEAGDHGPYDVVLELVGGPSFEANLPALAPGGRMAVIGVGGGPRVELDLLTLMGRRARVMGSTLRSRSLEEKALTARRVEAELLPLVEAGRLRVIVGEVFALESARDAYTRFQAGGKLGKIVLIVCALATGA